MSTEAFEPMLLKVNLQSYPVGLRLSADAVLQALLNVRWLPILVVMATASAYRFLWCIALDSYRLGKYLLRPRNPSRKAQLASYSGLPAFRVTGTRNASTIPSGLHTLSCSNVCNSFVCACSIGIQCNRRAFPPRVDLRCQQAHNTTPLFT
jgi:hypothetical protein